MHKEEEGGDGRDLPAIQMNRAYLSSALAAWHKREREREKENTTPSLPLPRPPLLNSESAAAKEEGRKEGRRNEGSIIHPDSISSGHQTPPPTERRIFKKGLSPLSPFFFFSFFWGDRGWPKTSSRTEAKKKKD